MREEGLTGHIGLIREVMSTDHSMETHRELGKYSAKNRHILKKKLINLRCHILKKLELVSDAMELEGFDVDHVLEKDTEESGSKEVTDMLLGDDDATDVAELVDSTVEHATHTEVLFIIFNLRSST